MSTTSGHVTAAAGPAAAAPVESGSYLDRGRGVIPWLFTLDHKRLGVMYLGGAGLSFVLGTVLALAVRSQLLHPGLALVEPGTFDRLFTLHGIVMVFLVLLPAIPAGLGNFLLPLMLGARNVALPRVNLAAFHLYLLGAALLLAAIITGGVDTGWSFETPYALTAASSVVLAVLGAVSLAGSALLTAITFMVTIHTSRPRGMTWFRMPLFAWALYAASAVVVVAAPLLGSALLLLAADRVSGAGLLDPAAGGDPVLFAQMFWFAAHPVVYVAILPALGVVAEIVATFSGRPVANRRVVALSFLALGACAFLGWGTHLLAGSQSDLASVTASVLASLAAIPLALVLFNLLATLRGGGVRLEIPMLYALASLVMLGVAAGSGLLLVNLATGTYLLGTAFEVGHLHYAVVGTVMAAFLAGLHYWWPKIFGRTWSLKAARFAARVLFIGFNLAFFTQFLLGGRGVPRRLYTYGDPPHTHYTLQWTSTMGAYLMAGALIIVFLYLRATFKRPRRAAADPWGGTTLEWAAASPPVVDNFTGASRSPYASGETPERYDGGAP